MGSSLPVCFGHSIPDQTGRQLAQWGFQENQNSSRWEYMPLRADYNRNIYQSPTARSFCQLTEYQEIDLEDLKAAFAKHRSASYDYALPETILKTYAVAGIFNRENKTCVSFEKADKTRWAYINNDNSWSLAQIVSRAGKFLAKNGDEEVDVAEDSIYTVTEKDVRSAIFGDEVIPSSISSNDAQAILAELMPKYISCIAASYEWAYMKRAHGDWDRVSLVPADYKYDFYETRTVRAIEEDQEGFEQATCFSATSTLKAKKAIFNHQLKRVDAAAFEKLIQARAVESKTFRWFPASVIPEIAAETLANQDGKIAYVFKRGDHTQLGYIMRSDASWSLAEFSLRYPQRNTYESDEESSEVNPVPIGYRAVVMDSSVEKHPGFEHVIELNEQELSDKFKAFANYQSPPDAMSAADMEAIRAQLID